MADSKPEEWRAVVGYEGFYEVSDHGRVRRLMLNGKTRLKTTYPHPGRQRYMKVGLNRPGEGTRTLFVHRLMGFAFIPNPHNLPNVCFHDNDKYNLRLDNLFWGDAKDALVNAALNGRLKPPTRETRVWATGDDHAMRRRPEIVQKGSKRYCAILNEEQVIQIRKLRKEGKKPKEIATLYGISRNSVYGICSGRKWKSVPTSSSPSAPDATPEAREK